MERQITYLAAPYSDRDARIREQRYREATKAAATMLRAGLIVFSPVTHFYPMEKDFDLPGDWAFWRRIDTIYLNHAKELVVLCLDGYQQSAGVREEVQIAREQQIDCWWVCPDDVKPWLQSRGLVKR